MVRERPAGRNHRAGVHPQAPDLHGELGNQFYAFGIDVYEKILRDVKKNLLAHRLSPIYLQRGYRAPKGPAFGQGFLPTEIFVLVDEGAVEESLTTRIPASPYLQYLLQQL